MQTYEMEEAARRLDGIACALDIMAQAAEDEGIEYANLGALLNLLSKEVSEARGIIAEALRSDMTEQRISAAGIASTTD